MRKIGLAIERRNQKPEKHLRKLFAKIING